MKVHPKMDLRFFLGGGGRDRDVIILQSCLVLVLLLSYNILGMSCVVVVL